MIQFYFHPTPNPTKVALYLEETSLPYESIPVDTSKGEQDTLALARSSGTVLPRITPTPRVNPCRASPP